MPEQPPNGDTRVAVAVVTAEFRSCKEASMARHQETTRRLDAIDETLKSLQGDVRQALLSSAQTDASSRTGMGWAQWALGIVAGLGGGLVTLVVQAFRGH